jgi:hypothetical protein
MHIETQAEHEQEQRLIHSYLWLRRAVGGMGALLPFVLWGGALLIDRTPLLCTISSYYYTVMRGVFVGALWAMGTFLIFYTGYGGFDNFLTTVAGVSAICVSLFPTMPALCAVPGLNATAWAHFAFAALFLGALAAMSFWQFTRTGSAQTHPPLSAYRSLLTRQPVDTASPYTRRKLQRNLVYYGCALVIAMCMAWIAVTATGWTTVEGLARAGNRIFWLETAAILAYGVSWFVKGETLWRDRPTKQT